MGGASCGDAGWAYNVRAYWSVRQAGDTFEAPMKRAQGGSVRPGSKFMPSPNNVEGRVDQGGDHPPGLNGCTNCPAQRHNWFAEKKTRSCQAHDPFSFAVVSTTDRCVSSNTRRKSAKLVVDKVEGSKLPRGVDAIINRGDAESQRNNFLKTACRAGVVAQAKGWVSR